MSKVASNAESRIKAFDSVEIERVELHDSLMKRRRDVNTECSLLHQYKECERTGRIDNFRIAAGLKEGEYCGRLASDSDVYKWIEAVAYTIATDNVPDLKTLVDETIELIEQSQDEDGYLNTAFLGREEEKWTDPDHGHELYCGGHLIQAAIAWKRATGASRLLDTAIRWADYICSRFGPDAKRGSAGHPEVEMALVELYRETGSLRYLNTATFFIEERGKGVLDGTAQIQDHAPVRAQVTVEGHAVRQLYLASGITDIYAETGEDDLMHTLKKQWHNFTSRKMAITGGAGARHTTESFGLDYEIPNRTGYYETCASIASFMWNWRCITGF